MVGGSDGDTYIVGSTGDVVIELAGGGIDTVRSFVNWTLGAEVEHLILTGSANRTGTGNGLDNQITGNTGNNVLSGLDGNDTLTAARARHADVAARARTRSCSRACPAAASPP